MAPHVETDRLRPAALDALNAISEVLLTFEHSGIEPVAVLLATRRLREVHTRLSAALHETS